MEWDRIDKGKLIDGHLHDEDIQTGKETFICDDDITACLYYIRRFVETVMSIEDEMQVREVVKNEIPTNSFHIEKGNELYHILSKGRPRTPDARKKTAKLVSFRIGRTFRSIADDIVKVLRSCPANALQILLSLHPEIAELEKVLIHDSPTTRPDIEDLHTHRKDKYKRNDVCLPIDSLRHHQTNAAAESSERVLERIHQLIADPAIAHIDLYCNHLNHLDLNILTWEMDQVEKILEKLRGAYPRLPSNVLYKLPHFSAGYFQTLQDEHIVTFESDTQRFNQYEVETLLRRVADMAKEMQSLKIFVELMREKNSLDVVYRIYTLTRS